MATWTTEDYFNPFPQIGMGLAQRNTELARVDEQERQRRIERVEEMRRAAEIAQEQRLAAQYATTQQRLEQQHLENLAQRRAVQERLEQQFMQGLDIKRAENLGRSGMPAPVDLDQYGIGAYNRGWHEYLTEKDKQDLLENPDMTVNELIDKEGNVVGLQSGNIRRFDPEFVEWDIKRDWSGREVSRTPIRSRNRRTLGVVSEPQGTNAPPVMQGGTNAVTGIVAPAPVQRFRFDPATGKTIPIP